MHMFFLVPYLKTLSPRLPPCSDLHILELDKQLFSLFSITLMFTNLLQPQPSFSLKTWLCARLPLFVDFHIDCCISPAATTKGMFN